METLSHEQARRTYDRVGALQDSQKFYEDPAIDVLLDHGAFREAQSVFEFGCGTGRFANRLLDRYLPPTAHYTGIDISPKMVRLAQEILAEYAPRANVILTNGELPTAEQKHSFDRFVSTYVFDLLSESETAAVIDEAHRLLRKDGLLCLASITSGTSLATRAVALVTRIIHRVLPSLLGGCRPITLIPFLPADQWIVLYHTHIKSFGVASEIVVATPC